MTDSSGIICRLSALDALDISNRTDALQIYRIIQEAVNNALKHAQATSIRINFKADHNAFEFSVCDDGCGFDTGKSSPEGLGLRIMRYRAGIIGCNLLIKSVPGKGTTLKCKHEF